MVPSSCPGMNPVYILGHGALHEGHEMLDHLVQVHLLHPSDVMRPDGMATAR